MTVGDAGQQERHPDWAAFVIAALLALAAIGIAWSTRNAGGITAYTAVGPKTVPYIVAACLFGLAIWTAIEAWRGDFPEREALELPPILWVVGGLVLQLLTIKTLGFSIATGFLFAATAYAFRERRVWLTIPFGIALAFAVWFVFAQFLMLSLPVGPLERLVGG